MSKNLLILEVVWHRQACYKLQVLFEPDDYVHLPAARLAVLLSFAIIIEDEFEGIPLLEIERFITAAPAAAITRREISSTRGRLQALYQLKKRLGPHAAAP
jgi:hypothetical protein